MAKFISKYDGYFDVGLDCGTESMTQQQFKEECDINNILKRYQQTGVLPEMREAVQKNFGDFSNLPDFQDALNIVLNAQEAFDSLDARTRDRFANDPAKMVAFCEDNANYDEAVKLGLIKKGSPVSESQILSGETQSPKEAQIKAENSDKKQQGAV